MRMLLNIRIPHEPFNTLVRDGSVGDVIGRILEAVKPEAVFHGAERRRAGVVIVDLNDPSQIPALAEPWFLMLNAGCEFRVVMFAGRSQARRKPRRSARSGNRRRRSGHQRMTMPLLETRAGGLAPAIAQAATVRRSLFACLSAVIATAGRSVPPPRRRKRTVRSIGAGCRTPRRRSRPRRRLPAEREDGRHRRGWRGEARTAAGRGSGATRRSCPSGKRPVPPAG